MAEWPNASGCRPDISQVRILLGRFYARDVIETCRSDTADSMGASPIARMWIRGAIEAHQTLNLGVAGASPVGSVYSHVVVVNHHRF